MRLVGEIKAVLLNQPLFIYLFCHFSGEWYLLNARAGRFSNPIKQQMKYEFHRMIIKLNPILLERLINSKSYYNNVLV